jgi:hypothetical protein
MKKMINVVKSIYSVFRSYLRSRRLSDPNFQKEHWEEFLENHDKSQSNTPFGFEWGDPEDSQDRFGNYLSVKKLLMSKVNSGTTVLEIGALGGKWTQYLMHAKLVIAVDINEKFKDYLKNKFPGKKNLEFM